MSPYCTLEGRKGLFVDPVLLFKTYLDAPTVNEGKATPNEELGIIN